MVLLLLERSGDDHGGGRFVSLFGASRMASKLARKWFARGMVAWGCLLITGGDQEARISVMRICGLREGERDRKRRRQTDGQPDSLIRFAVRRHGREHTCKRCEIKEIRKECRWY